MKKLTLLEWNFKGIVLCFNMLQYRDLSFLKAQYSDGQIPWEDAWLTLIIRKFEDVNNKKIRKIAAHMSVSSRACDSNSVFQKIKSEGASPDWFCEADIWFSLLDPSVDLNLVEHITKHQRRK